MTEKGILHVVAMKRNMGHIGKMGWELRQYRASKKRGQNKMRGSI